ncbi:hypothetical protein V1478_010563 [Vespula squamosa]|uniref:Uncharacterized protein n=1 Tax=Vespula squamosa TaxID=30214 RepID=A0ABD2AI45_VESSQ
MCSKQIHISELRRRKRAREKKSSACLLQYFDITRGQSTGKACTRSDREIERGGISVCEWSSEQPMCTRLTRMVIYHLANESQDCAIYLTAHTTIASAYKLTLVDTRLASSSSEDSRQEMKRQENLKNEKGR